MKVAVDELRGLVQRALEAAGANASMAEATARALVLAESQGLGSHGLSRVAQYATHLRNGRVNPAAVPHVGSVRGGAVQIGVAETESLATAMVVLATYWLSFEYVRDPRRALEGDAAARALGRGAFHVLSLLLPYLEPASRAHLHALAASYH